MQGKSHKFWRLGQGHLWGPFFCLLYCVKQRCDNTPENKLFAVDFLRGRSFPSISCTFLGQNSQFNIHPPPRKGDSQMAPVVKNPPANAGDTRNTSSIPGLGRSSGGGNDNPLQYSFLEDPKDRGALWATVYGITKSQTWLHMHDPENIRRQLPTRKGMGTDLEWWLSPDEVQSGYARDFSKYFMQMNLLSLAS